MPTRKGKKGKMKPVFGWGVVNESGRIVLVALSRAEATFKMDFTDDRIIRVKIIEV